MEPLACLGRQDRLGPGHRAQDPWGQQRLLEDAAFGWQEGGHGHDDHRRGRHPGGQSEPRARQPVRPREPHLAEQAAQSPGGQGGDQHAGHQQDGEGEEPSPTLVVSPIDQKVGHGPRPEQGAGSAEPQPDQGRRRLQHALPEAENAWQGQHGGEHEIEDVHS